jgi:hypothetical protein
LYDATIADGVSPAPSIARAGTVATRTNPKPSPTAIPLRNRLEFIDPP